MKTNQHNTSAVKNHNQIYKFLYKIYNIIINYNHSNYRNRTTNNCLQIKMQFQARNNLKKIVNNQYKINYYFYSSFRRIKF